MLKVLEVKADGAAVLVDVVEDEYSFGNTANSMDWMWMCR